MIRLGYKKVPVGPRGASTCLLGPHKLPLHLLLLHQLKSRGKADSSESPRDSACASRLSMFDIVDLVVDADALDNPTFPPGSSPR